MPVTVMESALEQMEIEGLWPALSQAALVKPLPIVLYNLGLTHFYRGDMAGAREKFQAALAAEGGEPAPRGEIYYYIVHSYLQEGDMDRARTLLRENEAAIPSDLRADLAARL